MIENELFESYSDLKINEKRNQLSLELEKLNALLDTVHQQYGIERMPSSFHTYNKAIDENMTEEKYIELMYENVIFLRKGVLTLVNAILTNKPKEIDK